MSGINFIGSNSDDTDAKQSRRYDFDYTDPDKDKAEVKINKPRMSFLHRQKKKTVASKKSDDTVSAEDKFVDKNLVRKGKYKAAAVATPASSMAAQSSSTLPSKQVPTYAPSRHVTETTGVHSSTPVSSPSAPQKPASVMSAPAIPVQPIMATAQANVLSRLKTIPTPPPAPRHSVSQPTTSLNQPVSKITSPQPIAVTPPVAPVSASHVESKATMIVPAAAPIQPIHAPQQPLSVKSAPPAVAQSEIKPPTAQTFPNIQAAQRRRIIPTPPPPPIHATPITATPAHTPPMSPPPISAAPAQPIPPSQPIAAIPAGQPRAQTKSAIPAEQPGVVHTHNVEHVHGKQTDPQLISGKMLVVNLLPLDLLKKLNPANRIVGLIKAALVSCTVIGLLYGAMVGYQSYFIIQTKNNQIEIKRLEQEIGAYSALQKEVKATNTELELINTLLAEHSYWSNVFALLEAYTLPNVYYQSFSGNTSGLISLQAVATDFSSISQQVHIFNDDNLYVRSASVTSGTRSSVVPQNSDTTEADGENVEATGQDIVTFMINLEFDPTIFSYQSDASY